MKITVIGTGYVGLVSGTCFSNMGNDVICLDVDEKKIENLKKGILPIYEPGLKELVDRNAKEKRLFFTTDAQFAIETSDILFICVGTPESEDGSANLKYVYAVAETIGKHMNSRKVVVTKSTVPVGTADEVRALVEKNRKEGMEFDVVSNPEFLREGQAIKDFMNPDRVVVGCDSDFAKERMTNLYKDFARADKPVLFADIKSAELIKYASNAMLATRISFMNQISHLCEKIGADVKLVAKGMGLDDRIGPRFLQAGVGYGGSCFPKDVKALAKTLKKHACESDILDAVDNANERQKRAMFPKVLAHFNNDLKDKKIAIWGLAFKPHTDDMREAPSVVIINELQEHGAQIHAFDPVAAEEAQHILSDVTYHDKPYDTLNDADAVIVVTEWDEFRQLDKTKMKDLMKSPTMFDGRNIYSPQEMRDGGFTYYGVGRGTKGQ